MKKQTSGRFAEPTQPARFGRRVVACVVLLLAVVGGWAATNSLAGQGYSDDKQSKPYTHLNFRNNPENFQFAVISDRAGGHRPGVFRASVDLLNLLQPEFVMSVGDFIEGYAEDEETLKAQWAEIDMLLERLQMPMFFTMGNHDVNLDPSEKVWFDRVGVQRGYHHFVYKDVLFMMLSTEDPPKNDPSDELAEKYEAFKAGKIDPAEAPKIIAELEAWAGQVNISDAQVEYFKKALADNKDVRWTIAFMHTPCWTQEELRNFTKIEAMLQDRPYTVFAGHTHTYAYERRKGRDYVTMGATGGAFSAGHQGLGNMDHVAWVTMTDEGPIISNLLMNGIMDKRGPTHSMSDFLEHRGRQITMTGQSLGVKSVPNLRDLGGYTTEDGRVVVNGLVYRANQLHGVGPTDMKKLANLKLKSAFDLRTLDERSSRPGELPADVNYVWLDVLADSPQAGPAMLEKMMTDPKVANADLGGGKIEAMFADSYREFISLQSACHEYRKLFLSLADEHQTPALFHCTTGKDRTGWAAAALLTLLGVPRETVYEDYLLSNGYILPLYKGLIDEFTKAGGEERIPVAIFGVRKEYLDAAFDEMEKKYGTIEKYFSEGLKIDEETQAALRKQFLR